MLSDELLERLRGRVFVQTGAGVSAASGIQTFRGSDGLYRGKDPYTLASPEGFFSDPDIVWNWYLMRIRIARNVQPNGAHRALVDLEGKAKALTLVTSNVDPLHEAAGSSLVHHLHGKILETRCTGCGVVAPLQVDRYPEEVDDDTLPTCDACGSLLRPNVVWFGETPWPEAIEAVQNHLPEADVMLEVGTSGVVTYHLDKAAIRLGIPVVRINPESRPEPGVTEVVGNAEEILPRIVAAL